LFLGLGAVRCQVVIAPCHHKRLVTAKVLQVQVPLMVLLKIDFISLDCLHGGLAVCVQHQTQLLVHIQLVVLHQHVHF
jgi:hypothetical protein